MGGGRGGEGGLSLCVHVWGVCVCACMSVCVYTCMSVCVDVCMCVVGREGVVVCVCVCVEEKVKGRQSERES